LSVLHKYLVHPAKILHLSAKPFLPCS